MSNRTEMIPYADIRRMTLELINRYSVGGETFSPAYNNQSDITGRIPNLINQALTQISLSLTSAREPLPGRLSADPSDADELNAPFLWVQAACYYAAAYLVMDDDQFQYAALMNEFETFVSRLKGRVCASYPPTPDAYGNWGCQE